MTISLIYLICFIISAGALLYLVLFEEDCSASLILMVTATVVGNGGYYALSLAQNLEEAILSIKISYTVGIFVPMLLFVIVCEVYGMEIPKQLMFPMYLFQTIIYFGVISIGRSHLYYDSITFAREGDLVTLSKTYGPLHSLYVFTMYGYLIGVVLVSVIAISKRNMVSIKSVMMIFFLEFITIACYTAERMVNLQVEIIPIVETTTLIMLLVPVTKLHRYSLSINKEIVKRRINSLGYMIFDKRLRIMSYNKFAAGIFPELTEWELEKNIPGSGGRFNTYLRQQFYDYIKSKDEDEVKGDPFVIKNTNYRWRMGQIRNRMNLLVGYIIEIEMVGEKNE